MREKLEYVAEVLTCDHIASHAATNGSCEGHMYAIVFFVFATLFVGICQAGTRIGVKTYEHLCHYEGRESVDCVYSDSS